MNQPSTIGHLKWNSRTGELKTQWVLLVVTHQAFGTSKPYEVGVRVPLTTYLSMAHLISRETEQVVERMGEEPQSEVAYLQDLKEMMEEGEASSVPLPQSYQDYPEWGDNESRDQLIWGLCVLTNSLVRTGILQGDEANGVRVFMED